MVWLILVLALGVFGCKRTSPPARITQFRAMPAFIPRGITGKLCYGVENATRLELEPRVEDLLPASGRCIDIAPRQKTTYTLTAYGEGASKDTKSLDVDVGEPAPRLSNLAASSTQIKRGAQVRICFKVENAKSVKASPGRLDRAKNCLVDYPKKTTAYKIVAMGADRAEDTGTVTVKVR